MRLAGKALHQTVMWRWPCLLILASGGAPGGLSSSRLSSLSDDDRDRRRTAAGAAAGGPGGQQPPPKPHLLFALVDDLGHYNVELTNPEIKTPFLVDLRKQGIFLNRRACPS
eukprot:SAG22_NODE_126_length_18820_cov_10.207788_9_plen_112_part_00